MILKFSTSNVSFRSQQMCSFKNTLYYNRLSGNTTSCLVLINAVMDVVFLCRFDLGTRIHESEGCHERRGGNCECALHARG